MERRICNPAAGLPSEVSKTWVDKCAISAAQAEPKAAIRRTRVSIDSSLIALFQHSVPSAVACFQVHGFDAGQLRQDSSSQLVDHLLNAAGLEGLKDVQSQRADARGGLALCEARGRRRVEPLQIKPHVERPVSHLGECGVLIANKTLERTASEAHQAKTANARLHLDEIQPLTVAAHFHARSQLFRKKAAIRFQIASAEIERLSLDEIFHRIGGNEAGVVTLGVRRPKGVAI